MTALMINRHVHTVHITSIAKKVFEHISSMDTAHNLIQTENGQDCGDRDILGHFKQGNLKAIFADADMKKRLTLTCQFCNDSYSMVKHMANHIFVHHGELAEQADLLCNYLKAHFGPVHGCVCNPQVKKLQQAHVCLPYLQLAMMHFQGGDWLSIPIVYTEAVRDSMIIHVPINSILHICDSLRDREFQQLLQDKGFRLALRDRCLCCGKNLTVGGPSLDHNLDFHLRAEHPEPSQAIAMLLDMLQHYHANDSEKTCEWCLANIETSAADGDLSSHLSEYGVVRNLITWLCQPLLPNGDRAPGRTHRSAGTHGHGLGSTKRPAPQETPWRHTISAAFKRQQVRRHEETAHHDGQPVDSTRERSSSSAEPVMLHPVSSCRTGWNSTLPDSTISGVEEKQDPERRITTETNPPATHPDTGEREGYEDSTEQGRRSTPGCEREVQAPIGGQKLASTKMVPANQDAGDQWKTTINTHGRDDAEIGQSDKPLPEGTCSGSISLPEIPGINRQCHPMEAGPGRQGATSASGLSGTDALKCMATGISAREDAQLISEQAGRSDTSSTTSQKQEMTLMGLFDSLHNMVLVNNRVECYANSAFWTVSWMHLLCKDMTVSGWANLRAPFAEIILQGSGHPIDLKCHSLMQSGLTQWKLLRKGDQQEDHSDFLGWMGTTKVTHEYEKRLEIANGVQPVEKGGPNSPILLLQEMWEHLPCPTAISDVLHNLMTQTGMTSALQIASTLVCL